MTTPIEQIRAELRKEAERNIGKVVTMLNYVGNEVVNQIRNSDISDWIDRTGNLRSSIGYVVTVDGVPVKMSGFAPVKGPELGDNELTGSDEGKGYAERLASVYAKGIALIVVAGMEYASYVEKMENKVVLAGGEIEARKLVAQMIEQLNGRKGK